MFDSISDRLGRVFDTLRGKVRVSEEHIEEAVRDVRMALLEADVSLPVVREFTERVKTAALGAEVLQSVRPSELIVKIVNDELIKLLGTDAAEIGFVPGGITTIMFCGLQGSGKTTTVGKLASRLKGQGRKPLLVAADVQRPAAIEQLKTLGGQLSVPVYAEAGGDPVTICERAREIAGIHGADTILLDTAGRLHVDEALMVELERIVTGTKPNEVLLVLDAMTGQDAVHSAEEFARRLPLTGAILTKLDGDARGGAALSLRQITGVPIKFCGMGEKLDALEEFHPDRMAGRILGMGDVVSLVEKAQAHVSAEEQAAMQEKLLENSFTLTDFQKQLAQIRKMGPIKDLLGMLPGIGRVVKDIDIDEHEFVRIEAIIQSMTPKERDNPEIIEMSRRDRIAKGSGTDIADVNNVLKQFREMKKMIGGMKRSGLLAGMLGGKMPSFMGGGLPGGADPSAFAGLRGGAVPTMSKAQQEQKRKERKKQKLQKKQQQKKNKKRR